MKQKLSKLSGVAAALVMLCMIIPAALAIGENVIDTPVLPPIEEITIEDATRYMECNSYVLDTLDNSYNVFFPDEIPSNVKAEYRYHYSCAPFGDPEFSIYLKLSYETYDEYSEDQQCFFEEWNHPRSAVLLLNEVYPISGSEDDVKSYLDDQILDGKSYNFEIVRCNNRDWTIEYYISQLWDGHVSPDEENALRSFFDLEE